MKTSINMTLKNLLLVGACLAAFTACSASGTDDAKNENSDTTATADVQPTTEKAVIRGTLRGSSGDQVFLQYVRTNDLLPIDTAITNDKGGFVFEFYPEKVGYYRVAMNDNDGLYLIVGPGDKLELNADAGNLFRSFRVSGNRESERLKQLNLIISQMDSINMVLQTAQLNQDTKLLNSAMAEYERKQDEVKAEVMAFILEDPGSFASLAALQNLVMMENFEYYEKVINALEGKADGNEIYEMMKLQVNALRKLAPGSVAPDFTLPQPDGTPLSLSDLRGKYVLIDFWASWCGPCRKENPNVKRVYEKYRDKGFEILGVSLDKNRNAWLAAIEQDGLSWKHVSDLKYWQSEVVPVYQVQGIPLTYLIDPEGKIVAKNLRGPALEKKLAEIFQSK
ncbi:MAG: TlpA disulfide reductase family protein [Salibacteraceae bacterium]